MFTIQLAGTVYQEALKLANKICIRSPDTYMYCCCYNDFFKYLNIYNMVILYSFNFQTHTYVIILYN